MNKFETTKAFKKFHKSTSSKKLHVNRTRSTCTYGDRSFSVGAARLWNELPQHFMPLEDKESKRYICSCKLGFLEKHMGSSALTTWVLGSAL
jgi:hypothetical protein